MEKMESSDFIEVVRKNETVTVRRDCEKIDQFLDSENKKSMVKICKDCSKRKKVDFDDVAAGGEVMAGVCSDYSKANEIINIAVIISFFLPPIAILLLLFFLKNL